ncbi:MAG TPA: hypothetical protein VFO44_11920 [Steroidobacteraceae bacterium]|nr:hypothetical protein [Steroidobacteraceae bacterium]
MTGPWLNVFAATVVILGIGVEIGDKGASPVTVFGALPSVIVHRSQNSIDVKGIEDMRSHRGR